ncbi:MAG TPA: FtsW/RodA/SpoVE family cell cycle protein [Candidatus Paceibacterota bacterium]|nr:FtsW/RodA/SpoVE family cell cycle protein [Candidatus Paceibacterota bacterium]
MQTKLSVAAIPSARNIFLPLSIVLLASLVVLSSVSQSSFYKQAVFMALGLALIFVFKKFDWRSVLGYRWFIIGFYALSILLLILVLVIGPNIRNVKSWLVIGPFSLQPAELAKISLILLLAEYFSRRHLSVARWKIILTSFLFFIVPALLVALQPALGSAVVLFGIWFGFLLLSGLPRDRIFLAVIAFIICGFFIWNWGLKDYQKLRIVHYFYPEKNVLGANYSVVQSKIAIGSAGMFGKGYGQGSQTQLGFLTEPTNDFIVAALIEEWGIAGGVLVIAAFFALILGILKIGISATRNFDKFICLGTAIVFSMQAFFNSGSALGLVPVVGIPFPFLSYGGSSILTSFLLIAIIIAIESR